MTQTTTVLAAEEGGAAIHVGHHTMVFELFGMTFNGDTILATAVTAVIVIALAFVGVTGNVTVGYNHDWATDAMVAIAFTAIPLMTAALGASTVFLLSGLAFAATVTVLLYLLSVTLITLLVRRIREPDRERTLRINPLASSRPIAEAAR